MEKKFAELTFNVTDEEYYKDDINHVEYSYSLISRFQQEGYKDIAALFEPRPKTEALTFGSLVDCMLTDEENLESRFAVVADLNKVDPKIDGIVKTMIERDVDYSVDKEKELLAILDDYSYWARYKPETRIKHIYDDSFNYYNVVKQSKGKTVVTQEQYDKAAELVKAAREHAYVGDIIGATTPFVDEEKLWQPKFKVKLLQGDPEMHPLVFKAMMDLVVVNNEQRTIQIYDIKTSACESWNFPDSYWKWNYHYQATLYEKVMKRVIAGTEYEDYDVLPLKFIVLSKTAGEPLVWERCQNFEEVQKHYDEGEYNVFIMAQRLDNAIRQLEEGKTPMPEYIKTMGYNEI